MRIEERPTEMLEPPPFCNAQLEPAAIVDQSMTSDQSLGATRLANE